MQYIADAGRSRSEKHSGDVTGTTTTDRAKAESKLETIKRFREIGFQFIRQQQDYLKSIEDPVARNEADIVITTGNQLMRAAVLTEMSKSGEYSEQLINMLQDEGLRWYVVHGLSQYFPALSKHIEQGGKIDAGNVATLFSGDRNFLAEFETRVASKLSADDAAAFETGIAHLIAAEVLTWQGILSGELDKRCQPKLYWDRATPDE